ncbi:hypothetical protein TNCV_427331 [Trichonephila clavipes]|nr:hypothetical protein TNCV_427331 [Trichonephila clavipes]
MRMEYPAWIRACAGESRGSKKERRFRLPSYKTTPIHSPSNLSDRPGLGFVISHSNKPRFASCIHTNRYRFNPPSF